MTLTLIVYWGHEFDVLSGSPDVIGDHLIPHRPFPTGGSNQA